MTRYIRVSFEGLVVIALISLGLFLFLNNSIKNNPWYKYKINAAKHMNKMQNEIKQKLQSMDIQINKDDDPNKSGLLGPKDSQIVTDTGILEAKFIATNPNMGAVAVDLLKRAGVMPGDVIAIGYTGSIVGGNLSILSAVHALKLRPVIIASAGASNYGATNPKFAWLDMEAYLYEKNLIPTRSIAASYGGKLDIAYSLPYEGKVLLWNIIKKNKRKLIWDPVLETNVETRLKYYAEKARGPIKAYVNVGGGFSSLGSSDNAILVPGGYNPDFDFKTLPERGVIVRMAEMGIPVINIEKIRDIALEYGLPLNPHPMEKIGEGAVFYREGYNLVYVIASIIIICLMIVLISEFDLRIYQPWKETLYIYFSKRGKVK